MWLCGFLTRTEEDLDLHLFTCEIYLCDDCSARLKTISDLKKQKIINNRYYKIIHAKIGKNSVSEIKQKFITRRILFHYLISTWSKIILFWHLFMFVRPSINQSWTLSYLLSQTDIFWNHSIV